jgi:putative transposase
MSEKYKIGVDHVPHFITCTVTNWIDIFTRRLYKDIVIDSLKFCCNHKGMKLHAFCIMTNHLHLIVSSHDHKLSDIIRDFKKFTAKEIIASIQQGPESRSEWILPILKDAADKTKRGKLFRLWQDGFHPIELNTPYLQDQKLDYIHENPVREGIVWAAEDYVYSSASFYAGRESVVEIYPIG